MATARAVKSCRTCKSCMKADEETGYCRRFPPQLVSQNQSAFPPVKLDGWICDEWKKA